MLVNTENAGFRNYSRKRDPIGDYSGLYRDWRSHIEFPETWKQHAAAYRERRQLIKYGRTLNVEPIGGGPADTGR